MHLTAETLRLAERLIQVTSLGPVPEPSPSRRGDKAPFTPLRRKILLGHVEQHGLLHRWR